MNAPWQRRTARGGLLVAVVWPFVVTSPQAHRLGTTALAAVLLAASLVVTVGWLRTITLFQPAALGAAALVTTRLLGGGQALVLSLLLAVAAGVAVTTASLLLAGGRPRRGLPAASVGVAALVVLLLLPRATVTPFARPVLIGVDLAGERPLYLAALVFTVLVIGSLRRLRSSEIGRRLVAVGGDEGFAARCGIDVRAAWLEGVALAGGMAGAAGWLLAIQARGMPDPAHYSLTAAVVVLAYPLLGGASSLLGAGTVAVTVTAVPAFGTNALLDATVLGGAGLVLAAALRSDGLAGLWMTAHRRLSDVVAAGRWETPRWRISR